MKNYSGSVGKIESFSTVDGPGIRSTVFLTGCTLRCVYCHNPEFLVKGDNNTNAEELASKLLKNKNYFKNGGGVTFSGGEPLLQSDFIIETAKILKNDGVHIALDTAGVGNYNPELLKYIDLVLLDIKASDEKLYEKITGVNRLEESLEFLKKCQEECLPVIIRQVIVPNINDNKEEILKLKELLKPFKNIIKIELLPYHNMALDKYAKLNKDYPLKEIKSLPISKLKELEKYL